MPPAVSDAVHRALLLLALLTSGLAGCVEPGDDFSRERLQVSVRSDGDWEVAIPLWVAPGGVSAREWVDAFRVHGGDATVAFTQTDRGPALQVNGTGFAELEANDVLHRDRPRAFLDGDYSLGLRDGGPALWVESGDARFNWIYEGTSDGCSLFINHHVLETSPGWQGLQGSGRSPGPDCV